MKKTNWGEKIGLLLIIFGFFCMIINGRISNSLITQVVEKYQLFYWSGLAIWALGYLKNEAYRKKEENGKNINK